MDRGHAMRIPFLLILTILLSSCGDKPDQSFSPSFLLGTTGIMTIPSEDQIAEPAFAGEDRFATARENEQRVLSLYSLEGEVEEEVLIYLYPAADRIENIIFKENSQTALFTVGYDGSQQTDICRIVLGTSDHNAFEMDGGQNILLPNPLSLKITSLTYPWDDQLAYLGTEYDFMLNTATQRLYFYDFASGVTQTAPLFPTSFALDGNGDLIGDYYYRIDAFEYPDSPGYIPNVLVCQKINSGGDEMHTFKMIRQDGLVDFDATGTYEFQDIGGVRFLDEQTILFAAKKNDLWQILSINSSGDEVVYYEAPDSIYELRGLDLSPSGDRCITQIIYNENDSYSDILVLAVD